LQNYIRFTEILCVLKLPPSFAVSADHMKTFSNRQWIYHQRPENLVQADHYRLQTSELEGTLVGDEVLLAARFISVDPYMRINQARSNTWMPPHPLHEVQGAATVAQVLASASSALREGDWVLAYSGWQTHAKLSAGTLSKIDTSIAPPETWLSAMGMPGRTAWFGLMEAGRPRPGEVVVVSGAAGAVGMLVTQLARLAGATVVAIAGTEDKCAWLQSELGAHYVLNYKTLGATGIGAFVQQLGGFDVYFDNVGGWLSDTLMPLMRKRARIVICGQISQYSGGLDAAELAPRFLHHVLYQRASIQGILARDFAHRIDEQHAAIAPLLSSGLLKSEHEMLDGFERLPEALNQLFTGHPKGKLMVRL
jgi:hypothetical protein